MESCVRLQLDRLQESCYKIRGSKRESMGDRKRRPEI